MVWRGIRRVFTIANDWIQDPAGLLVAFLAFLLAALVYMGLMRIG